MKFRVYTVFVCFFLLTEVYSDLCVKCYRFDTEGTWKFKIDAKTYKPDVFNPKIACGHQQPNVEGKQKDVKIKSPVEVEVHFEYPNNLYYDMGKGRETGWWTTVYNIGFMVRAAQKEFYGQFAYEKTDDSPCNQKCISYCDRTLASWYKDLKTGRVGCFYANKVTLFNKGREVNTDKAILKTERKSYNQTKTDINYNDIEFLINKINAQVDRHWTAKVNPAYANKTLKQLKVLMGQPLCGSKRLPLKKIIDYLAYPEKFRNPNATKSPKYKEDFENDLKNAGFAVNTSNEVLKYWYKHVDDIPESEIPETWDWRNVSGVKNGSGVNYVSKARSQVNSQRNE
eukprot:TRINITY_DN6312_c0_g1_i1.p1 TRINITY_DN6312_c0_g1~~TRINITY_DN6312_c0_g1_i1.p1  ORF type:complete len:341 (+),score=80.45 TRINITY_DN6312_c0_g1_i1:190-1212(+)